MISGGLGGLRKAQALVALGKEVTVLTGSPLAGESELEEGYRIVRTKAFRTWVSEAAGADVVVIQG